MTHHRPQNSATSNTIVPTITAAKAQNLENAIALLLVHISHLQNLPPVSIGRPLMRALADDLLDIVGLLVGLRASGDASNG